MYDGEWPTDRIGDELTVGIYQDDQVGTAEQDTRYAAACEQRTEAQRAWAREAVQTALARDGYVDERIRMVLDDHVDADVARDALAGIEVRTYEDVDEL